MPCIALLMGGRVNPSKTNQLNYDTNSFSLRRHRTCSCIVRYRFSLRSNNLWKCSHRRIQEKSGSIRFIHRTCSPSVFTGTLWIRRILHPQSIGNSEHVNGTGFSRIRCRTCIGTRCFDFSHSSGKSLRQWYQRHRRRLQCLRYNNGACRVP